MTDKPHNGPADPNVEPEGYEPPTSSEELLERYKNGERYSPWVPLEGASKRTALRRA